MLRYPGAILFDIDNTVYPYHPCHQAGLDGAWKAAAEVFEPWRQYDVFLGDYSAARDRMKARLGRRASAHCRLLYFKEMVDRHLGGTSGQAVLELRRAYWEAYFAGMKADPGCVEFLKMIRGRGVRSAWVSNYATERQILKLNALGLDGLADFLVTSEEAGGEKPDPAPFMLALEKLGKKPEECWMVGDDPGDDVEASIRLGLQGIWFFRDGSTPPGGKTFETVKDWHQLTEIFEKCGKMATAMK